MLKNLLIMAAAIADKEDLIESLEESIKEYKIDSSDKNFKLLATKCSLIMAKVSMEGEGGLEKFIDSLEKTEKARKMFDTEDN